MTIYYSFNQTKNGASDNLHTLVQKFVKVSVEEVVSEISSHPELNSNAEYFFDKKTGVAFRSLGFEYMESEDAFEEEAMKRTIQWGTCFEKMPEIDYRNVWTWDRMKRYALRVFFERMLKMEIPEYKDTEEFKEDEENRIRFGF